MWTAIGHSHHHTLVVVKVCHLQHGPHRITFVGTYQTVTMVLRAITHTMSLQTVGIIRSLPLLLSVHDR